MKIDFEGARLYVRPGPTDLRKGVTGLLAIIENEMHLDALSNSVFFFCNKSHRLLKIIFWNKTGFWLAQKRLEMVTWPWPHTSQEAAHIFISKYMKHTLFYCLEDTYNWQGICISLQNMCNWSVKVHERLKPLEELLLSELKKTKLLMFDESPVEVLKVDSEELKAEYWDEARYRKKADDIEDECRKNCYMWVVLGGTKETENYCLNRWENLENFIKYPEATFSTNAAERSVKSWVMARRNFLFSGSGNGARASCFIKGLLQTLKTAKSRL